MDTAHVWVIEESGGNVCVIGVLVVVLVNGLVVIVDMDLFWNSKKILKPGREIIGSLYLFIKLFKRMCYPPIFFQNYLLKMIWMMFSLE